MPLLERGPALASMATALTDATAGQGRIVLLSGEAGIGKTALLRSFLTTLPRNVRVLRGACDAPGPASARWL